ncbi:MAG: nucleoside hydrolase [Candidatus Poribacteria bacterium]|nr:nucleoside hydrolase [Candidatus Poribacteria bacterium]
MQKIILDTDIGDDIDDALALTFAILSGKIELLGVTTVFRNAQQRAELACCVLHALGRTDIPVYAGIGKTILQSIPDWEKVAASHRPRQMEILTKQQPSIQPQAGRAVDFIIDTVMSGDGDITLVPIGPLTNIAAAFTVEPRLAQKAKICMMGGATDRVRPEWNALCDPEATRMVFGTGVPITMVGLDVTTKCVLRDDQVKAIGAVDRPINQICFELIHLWSGDNPEPRPTLHDPLAVAMLIDPDFCEKRDMCIEVETRADHLRGATVPMSGDANASVCVSVDADRFMDYFVKTLIT